MAFDQFAGTMSALKRIILIAGKKKYLFYKKKTFWLVDVTGEKSARVLSTLRTRGSLVLTRDVARITNALLARSPSVRAHVCTRASSSIRTDRRAGRSSSTENPIGGDATMALTHSSERNGKIGLGRKNCWIQSVN